MLAQPRREEARQPEASTSATVSVRGLRQATSTVLLATLYILFAFAHGNAFLRFLIHGLTYTISKVTVPSRREHRPATVFAREIFPIAARFAAYGSAIVRF